MSTARNTFEALKARLLQYSKTGFGRGAAWAEIDSVEQRLGVRLPLSYRLFLHEFGWGGVEDIEIYGLGSDVPAHLHLVSLVESERTEMEPRLRHSLIPLMNDGRGNHCCLDTSRFSGDECPVVFWDHAHVDGLNQEPEPVAENFVTWLMEELEERDSEA